MARLNKFASVNLNDSYGNPDQRHGGSSSSSSSSSKPRPISSTSGGMLVLTRPGRGQASQPKPLSGRLGIPSPVNLPSLKREGSVIGSPEAISVSPPVSGWSKVDHAVSSPSPGVGWSAKSDPPSDTPDLTHKRSVTINSTENLKPLKSDVYAPPPLRSIQASSGSSAGTTPPPTPPLERKSVIRVEEFPTLQAAVARPPTPPQHAKQKEKKQLQDGKEQQQHQQGTKKIQDSHGGVLSPQAPLTLRPFGIQEPISHKSNAFIQSPHPMPFYSTSAYQVNRQAVDHCNEAQGDPPFVNNRSDAPREPVAHNLRPQYRTNSPITHENLEKRPSSAQSLRDISPYEKIEYGKPSDYMLRSSEGRDPKASSFGKEAYSSKDSLVSCEVDFRKGNAFSDREEYTKEEPGNLFHVRMPVTVYNSHDNEGIYGQKSFDRDFRNEGPSKGIQDSFSRDLSDNHNRKSSGFHSLQSSRPYSPGQAPDPWYSKRYAQYGSPEYPPKALEEHPSLSLTSLDPKSSRGLYSEPIDPFSSTESNRIQVPSSGVPPTDCAKEYAPQSERAQRTADPNQQLIHEHKLRESKWIDEKETTYYSAQRSFHRKEASHGRSALIDVNKKHDEEQATRDDSKKQIIQEEEKRKEAARLKLLELEDRIARREAEEGKKEVELRTARDNKPANIGVTVVSEFSSGRDGKQAMLDQQLPDEESKDLLLDKEKNLTLKAEHMDSKFSQASWVSLSPRVAVEAFVAQDPPQDIQSSLSQDRKIVRSRSPSSWRKESGSGPTSKLFSSPYIESGGFRRPTDGGTYKLF